MKLMQSRGLPDGENMYLWRLDDQYIVTLIADNKQDWFAMTNSLYVAQEIYKLDGSIK